jgi:hypothetical protein
MRFASLRALLTTLCLTAITIAGCKAAEHILGVNAGTGNQSIKETVGDLIDIRLYGGALGVFEAKPAISSNAVSFVEVVRDGVPTASEPVQKYRFRFRADAPGVAVLFWAVPQGAPTAVDTVLVCTKGAATCATN